MKPIKQLQADLNQASIDLLAHINKRCSARESGRLSGISVSLPQVPYVLTGIGGNGSLHYLPVPKDRALNAPDFLNQLSCDQLLALAHAICPA